MFVVVLFKITRTWKLLRCFLIVVYLYIVTLLNNRKEQTADIHKTWMDLKNIKLSVVLDCLFEIFLVS